MEQKNCKMEHHRLATPCYVIDLNQFEQNINNIKSEFIKEWGYNIILGYSIKTNHLPFFLSYAKKNGFYSEAVSSDEYYYAISQGYEPKEIIYNGPQKDCETVQKALSEGSIVNLDNFQDLKLIEKILPNIKKDGINIGIRVNFDLESICNGETNFEDEFSRFGFCVENGEFENALLYLDKLNCTVRGLHLHYTTKTRSLSVFKAIAKKVAELILKYKMKDGLKFIDMGGGFWGGRKFQNKPTMEEYSKTIAYELKKVIPPDKVQLILEPGSSLLATAVYYLTRVINTRVIRNTNIITVDGSLLHVNPFLNKRELDFSTYSLDRKLVSKQIICGSTCLEYDRILNLNDYNEFRVGDIIKIHNAGAYTMPFNNCFINCPPRIYLQDSNGYTQIRDEAISLMERI
ncbi:pyridoxal-dependent decarboxylase [Chengkuizengella sp. SCS-71B]|uniref:pyridoxal-dependent decarboxylase n=1 Tax=Chengkuizengella sp. SCS-71B TaxID=3115290 RepID=UPI0032C2400B